MGGVGTARGYDKAGNLIFHAKALTDSGFNIGISKEEIRGGEGAALHGQFFHTSQFGVNLKDALADLNYFALQVGGIIKKGGDIFKTEQITITTPNQITVEGTPKEFGTYGIIGWYNIVGEESAKTIKFSGKQAIATGVKTGDTVCVTYVEHSDSARAFEVATSFVPSEIHLVFDMPLFNASVAKEGGAGTQSRIGEYIIDVPRFQFNGSVDMSTAMAGASGVDISGMALQSGTSGCSGKGIYATITENIYGADPLENVYAIVVEDSDIDLKTNEKQVLKVMALYSDGTTPSLLDNKDLTFTSKTTSTAQVGANTGEVTAKATGESVIEIKVTSKPTLEARAVVTVTG